MWSFWVDRGGTFTDVVARDPQGLLHTRKFLSENPEQYDDAAVHGIRTILGIDEGVPVPDGLVREVRMGTTVATNALLERTGDPTVLVITAGFGDLLRIGYQNRPRLFDLDIVLPDLLHEHVVEAQERVAFDGSVIGELDASAVRLGLQAAFDDGIRAVAIALLHGHRFPAHEERIAAIAREIGFTQTSVSHRVSPLSKLVARGDTTVVDAYLSPILRRYVERVERGLGEVPLRFMQSNGGLTSAAHFQGKDAILSGPAGGVVGMAQTGQTAGFDRLIGFDMGGTSTDVAHFDGSYERSFETEVAGVRVRAPMMQVHTVAAGGGSVLHFDGTKFSVGPDSAGADPGPACYRRGGPLTVTDANVLLGRVQPEHFPSVFGPGADEPLDVRAVEEGFAEVARQVGEATDDAAVSVHAVAEGFLRIAVANMANAIKKISVMRGHDVTQYALACFGGAGGQHACLVADELGMSTIMVHPMAGVLSAYGMGLADVRAMRERQVDLPLEDQHLAVLAIEVQAMAADAEAELIDQGFDAAELRRVVRAHVRPQGSQEALPMEVDLADAMREQFASAHRLRFGFEAPERGLEVESVTVEVIGPARFDSGTDTATGRPAEAGRGGQPDPVSLVEVHRAGQWHDAGLHHRATLVPGDVIAGPAIIVEATGTTVVDIGWRANVDDERSLVLQRATPRPARVAVGTDVDPVLLEVFNNLFMSIAEQMGGTLANTSQSVNIKERLDFSCALFDAAGNLVANAPHVPVHLGSMGASVRTVLDRNAGDLRPGDAWVLNNPFDGGTHLPDVTVITPIFDAAGAEMIFVVGSRGHHADIGGRTPGSSPPDSTHIAQEGVLLDNVQLVRDGVFLEDDLREALLATDHPVRNVEQNLGDLRAQVAANETGAREVLRMVGRYGLDVVQAYMRHVQDHAEESVRRVIETLDDGDFRLPMDNGTHVAVAIRVDAARRSVTVDFTGTSPQDPGNHNAPLAVCRAAVLYVFRALVDRDIPLNEGCLRAIEIVAPPGTIVNPRFPAAVVAGNTEVSQAVTDALFGALGAVAGSQGTMNNLMYGNEHHQNYETIGGGTGAGPTFAGASAVQSHMTNTRMTDPEVLEQRLPVRVRTIAVRRGSGGVGKHAGGDGMVRALEFLEPMTVTLVTSNRIHRPFGMAGGGDGQSGANRLRRAGGTIVQLRGDVEFEVVAGDVVEVLTPGGGGWGTP